MFDINLLYVRRFKSFIQHFDDITPKQLSF